MSQAINKIKKRISSVTGAYKVTSAMKLISNVKLASYKSKMLATRDYSKEIAESIEEVFSHVSDFNSPFINPTSKNNEKLYIIVSSSLGLCGSYNSNIFKLADSNLTKDDEAIILGKKGTVHFANDEFKKIDGFAEYSSIKDISLIKALTNLVMNSFIEGQYKEIHLIYTTYKNPITFISKDVTLLPLSNFDNKDSRVYSEPLLEPSKEALVEKLIPLYVTNTLYSCLLESEVCEQASRSNAMENATKNAEELLDNLKTEFNKARQAAITQEITEIVSAAEAL